MAGECTIVVSNCILPMTILKVSIISTHQSTLLALPMHMNIPYPPNHVRFHCICFSPVSYILVLVRHKFIFKSQPMTC